MFALKTTKKSSNKKGYLHFYKIIFIIYHNQALPCMSNTMWATHLIRVRQKTNRFLAELSYIIKQGTKEISGIGRATEQEQIFCFHYTITWNCTAKYKTFSDKPFFVSVTGSSSTNPSLLRIIIQSLINNVAHTGKSFR